MAAVLNGLENPYTNPFYQALFSPSTVKPSGVDSLTESMNELTLHIEITKYLDSIILNASQKQAAIKSLTDANPISLIHGMIYTSNPRTSWNRQDHRDCSHDRRYCIYHKFCCNCAIKCGCMQSCICIKETQCSQFQDYRLRQLLR